MEARHVFSSSCVILGLFIAIVHGAHFEFGDGQQPCILLDIDATFDLSKGTQMADPFTLEGANITASQSLCGSETRSALLSLSVFPFDEQLKLTFRKEASTQSVSMSVVLALDPPKHFENASGILPFELEDSADLPVGVTNMSYKCNSQQEMFFNQDPGYSMTMDITNLHVQAYNIESGIFSSAIECDQDFLTTVPTTTPSRAPTTEEQTTVSTSPTTTIEKETTPETPATIVPETTTPETPATIIPETTTPETNATSPEPEPETTTPIPEPETTTPEPVPTIPKYEVKDGDTVCVVVQGEIKFNINYEKNDSQIGSAIVFLPNDTKVSGQCKYDGSNTTQEFKVSFFDDTWSFSALISQDEESILKSSGSLLRDLKAEPSYSWKRVELIYVVDESFPDAKDSDIGQRKNVTKDESEGAFKASGDGSYKCNTGETLELQEGISMDLGNFQYKAFGTDNSGNFTNNANSERFEVKSRVTGGACILLDIDATFNLAYTNHNKTEEAPVFTLKGATAIKESSSCGNVFYGTTSVLTARIFPSGELLMFTFERQNGNVVMSVRFTLNAAKHFKHMNDTTPIELNDEKHLPLGTDSPNSYVCLTQETVKFRPNNNFMMAMVLRNLKVQAYRIRDSTFGPVVECSQDSATSTPRPETTVVPHNETTSSQPETTTEILPNTTTEPGPETTPIKPNTTTEPQPETSATIQPNTTTPIHQNTTTEPEPETTTSIQPNMTTEPYSNMTTEPLPETTTQPEPETTTKPQPETTTAPEIETTTTMIPTTPFPHGSKYVVRDNEEVCIVLQGRITFDIPFQKKDGSTGTATVSVPDSVSVNGNCSYSDTEQEITLTFFKSQWMLDIVIAKESKSVLQNFALFKALSKSSDYSWQAVTLTYVMDSHFPNAKNQGMKVKAVADGTFGKFKANTDGSYMCNAEQDIEFGKDKKMKMDLSKMQYRAFGQTNSTDFPGTDVFECPADNNNNDNGKSHKTLGIALGCAFAGLIVIVFVACGITRYRKKKQQEGEHYDVIN